MIFRWAVVALFLSSLLLSWNRPLFSSHYYRQTQTAQTADIFRVEGWDPLLPKVRFMGKPGYTALELPIYQSAVVGITSLLPLSLEQAGRILSVISALLLGLALSKLISGRMSAWGTAWVMSAPLVFGTSQWFSIELANCALGAWAFVAFQETLKGPGRKRWQLLLGICAALSLAIKPVVIYCLLPVFAWRAWQNREIQAWIRVGIPCLLAAVFAFAWQKHAGAVNASVGNSFQIKGNFGWYFFNHDSFKPANIARVLSRHLGYVLGPGTLLILGYWGYARYSRRKGLQGLFEAWRKDLSWVIVFGAGIVLYTVTFMNVNIMHNYYQLPALVGVYAILLVLFREGWESRQAQGVFLLGLILNAGMGQFTLAKQDPEWPRALAFAQSSLTTLNTGGELAFVSNNEAALAAMGYSIREYGMGMRSAQLGDSAVRSYKRFVNICDSGPDQALTQSYDVCITEVKREFPGCADHAGTFGHLWVCIAGPS